MGKSSTASLASAFKLLLPSPMNPITFSKQSHFVTNLLSSLLSVSWIIVCEWCIYNICYSILLHPVPSLWGKRLHNYSYWPWTTPVSIWTQRGVLTDKANVVAQPQGIVLLDVLPIEQDLAAAWLIEPKNQWQNRGFSRSSCSQNASAGGYPSAQPFLWSIPSKLKSDKWIRGWSWWP